VGVWFRRRGSQLHWLPVQQHVVFKIATLVDRSLSSNAPGNLADDCPLVADTRVRQLRSVDTRTLVVGRTPLEVSTPTNPYDMPLIVFICDY